MKRTMKTTSILFLGLLILIGCGNLAEENFEYSFFTRIGNDYNTNIIQHYIISPPGYENKLIISYPSDFEAGIEAVYLEYEMDAMEITDEEIILKYEGNEIHFKRLSSSVVEDKNSIWYEYVENPEQ